MNKHEVKTKIHTKYRIITILCCYRHIFAPPPPPTTKKRTKEIPYALLDLMFMGLNRLEIGHEIAKFDLAEF